MESRRKGADSGNTKVVVCKEAGTALVEIVVEHRSMPHTHSARVASVAAGTGEASVAAVQHIPRPLPLSIKLAKCSVISISPIVSENRSRVAGSAA